MKFIIKKEDFFKEENPKEGICSAAEILSYNKSLDEAQQGNLSKLFDHLSRGRDVNISDIYTDRFGVDYVYVKVSFAGGKGGKKFKVIAFPNFEKFTDMLFDQRVGFQFNELIEYAEQLQLSKMDDDEVVITESKPQMIEKSKTKIAEAV